MPEEDNPVCLHRKEMIEAVSLLLHQQGFDHHYDTLPLSARIVSFLPLPTTFTEQQLCSFVNHHNHNHIAERHAQGLLQVGLWIGNLGHCVHMEGGGFWPRPQPRKPWIRRNGRDKCEFCWEFTPVLHAGIHLKITEADTTGDGETTLVSFVSEEEMKAGHFICLREWLNGLYNHSKGKDDAVQAMLELQSHTASQVHLRVIKYPYNGYYGFQPKPSYNVYYQKGWYCERSEGDTSEHNKGDWLRQNWEMFVQKASPWSSSDSEETNEYYQFWKDLKDQRLDFSVLP